MNVLNVNLRECVSEMGCVWEGEAVQERECAREWTLERVGAYVQGYVDQCECDCEVGSVGEKECMSMRVVWGV